MAATVQGFSATLEHEVARATEHARAAEAAAMTQRRLAATGELAAGVAHEINNPLGGLLNAAEALSQEKLPPEKRSQYQALLKSGLERIQVTVGRLLRLAPRQAKPQPISLAQPVADATALVQHRAAQLSIAIELTCQGRAEGAEERLAQAVLNLLVNALDALEDAHAVHGRIQVDLRLVAGLGGDELVVSVADNGPGVPAEELPRIADAFYTTKEVGRGTGLGLTIVHNVAASHGGRVELFSPPGLGFRAELHLPVGRASP